MEAVPEHLSISVSLFFLFLNISAPPPPLCSWPSDRLKIDLICISPQQQQLRQCPQGKMRSKSRATQYWEQLNALNKHTRLSIMMNSRPAARLVRIPADIPAAPKTANSKLWTEGVVPPQQLTLPTNNNR